MKTRTQQGFTLIELLVVITIIAILASLAVPTFAKIQERGNQVKGINNAKQIITTLKLYSADNSGAYPMGDVSKPTTSNDAFVLLFKAGVADSEAIFGCPGSEYGVQDGNLGASPTYPNALETKENHWVTVNGITDSASGAMPLVWECATDATWDPSWNADAAGKTTKGRTWSGGKVIVGTNDGSVAALPCSSSKGTAVKLKNLGTGSQNAFSVQTATGLTVLDVK